MTLIDNLKTQLTRDEGRRLKPYKDTVGKLTIGVGRNLDDEGISPDECDLFLQNDILTHQAALSAALPWTDSLDEARRGVLIAMSFNMGLENLLHFKKTLALVQAGNYDAAGDEMLVGPWATEVGARAHRLSLQMKSGQWQ
jgi:lysozyme